MQVKLHHYNLKLKDNFKISRLSFDIKPSLIVELQSQTAIRVMVKGLKILIII